MRFRDYWVEYLHKNRKNSGHQLESVLMKGIPENTRWGWRQSCRVCSRDEQTKVFSPAVGWPSHSPQTVIHSFSWRLSWQLELCTPSTMAASASLQQKVSYEQVNYKPKLPSLNFFSNKEQSILLNTHRRRRRDSTVDLSRVGVGSRDPVYNFLCC